MDDELAALLALDALEAEEQADAELRAGTWPRRLLDATVPLAAAASEPPPADLRDRVLAAALVRRPAGRPVEQVEDISPLDAYAGGIADLRALLDQLTAADAERPAHEEHGRVRDLVAHLAGVEELHRRWLDPDDGGPYLPDHVAATRDVVAASAGSTYEDVVERWYAAATALLEAARAEDLDRVVPVHDISVSVGGMLVMRTFELWAHGMDIALATDRPLPLPDDARMRMMSGRLMGALPQALLYRGVNVGERTARFVLTGPAGGCYDLRFDLAAGTGPAPVVEPDVTIVADVVELCRLAAARTSPAVVAKVVEGDADLADLVLANVDAFARD